MQYLMQLSDEFRDTYDVINRRVDDIQEEIKLLNTKLDSIEYNTNANNPATQRTLQNLASDIESIRKRTV